MSERAPVGLLRALLVARMQSSWNRSTKELGKRGRATLVATIATIVVILILPLTAEVAAAGFIFGAKIFDRRLGSVMFDVASLFLAMLTVGGGLLSGATGGTQQVRWEQYRAYPLRSVQLVIAEYASCLGEATNLGLALGIAAFLVGFFAARPAVWPLVPLVWFTSVALALTVQLFVGALGDIAVRRLRSAIAISVLAIAIGMQFTRRVAQGLSAPALLRAYAFSVRFLPTTWSVRGMREVALGHTGIGLAWALAPLAVVVPLAVIVGWLMVREQNAGAEEPASQRTRAKLWSFEHPALGVARLQFETILASRFGRFGIFLPLMSAAFALGPLSRSVGGASWRAPFVFGYVTFFSGALLFNQFGLDGQSVKGLFLLPIRARDLLRGKLLGYATIGVLYTAASFVLLAAFSTIPLTTLLAGVLSSGCSFLALHATGAWMSAMFPRPIPRWKGRGSPLPLPVMLLNLAVSLACMAAFTTPFAVLQWLAPRWLFPVMAVLFAATAIVAALVHPVLARYWHDRREAIVEAMG